MARQLTVLLFASALVVAAFAAETKPAPSFAAWLRKSAGAGKIAEYSGESDSSYYGSYYGVEAQQICLKDAWHKNCRSGTGGDIAVVYSVSEAVCCGGEDYSYYGYGDSKVIDSKTLDPSVALTCKTTATTFFTKPIVVVKDTTFKVGTAAITCVFKEPAEKCTGLSCEGVTITVDADVYDTEAYSHSPGYPLRHDEDCKALLLPKKDVAQKSKVMYAEEHDEHEYKEYKEKKTIYEGNAIVYTGPITSVNGGKEHKWVGGWFEQVTDFASKKVDEVDNEHAPWIHGNSFNIELLKSKSSY